MSSDTGSNLVRSHTYLTWRFKLSQAERTDDRHGALVIFIDDLDRCPKPRIVKALAEDYGQEDAHRFMEKIVQVTFNLPKVTDAMFEPFLDDLGDIPAEIANHLRLIMPAMGYNPRQLKRFVNNLNLRYGLMRSSGFLSYADLFGQCGVG
ncbi:P-loop NTPase fold protein [Desulfosarcina ovata]|uniref:KAP NTPase domain-containing protein n=2 Tax=Desulfosarcina ovata TaxID=83564 RepID=A0A5K8ACV9_9BACT|nr:P-loop NTPase fold protein [Desulfosarcina ovata]BBO83873.1 hypothetical protein DSCO28_44390 [Desulfosarcina ovata subsp. sediminis]BBO90366.1 hypothetical protein DSCOOX_35460 [Desulfosarcina ovata subsp. ovata]